MARHAVAVHLVWGGLCILLFAVLAFLGISSRTRIHTLQAEREALIPTLRRYEIRAHEVDRLERELVDLGTSLKLLNAARELLRSPADTVAAGRASEAIRHCCALLSECMARLPMRTRHDEAAWVPAIAALFALDQDFKLQADIEPLGLLYDDLLPWALQVADAVPLGQVVLRIQVLRGAAQRALGRGDAEGSERLQDLARHYAADVVEFPFSLHRPR